MTFHGQPHDRHHYEQAHESPLVMLVPLGVLAAGSILAGFPFKDLFAGHGVEEFFRELAQIRDRATTSSRTCITSRIWIAMLPTVMMVLGFSGGLAVLHPQPELPVELAAPAASRSTSSCSTSGISTSSTTSSSCVRRMWLGRFLWKDGDGWLIDGFGPDGVSARVLDVTRNVVRLQTGYLYHYAFAMLIGVAALITWFMFAGGVG